MKYRYTVLTYIVNNYEFVREVQEKDPDCEYVLVTDDPNLKSSTWKVVFDPDLQTVSPLDACYSVRFNLFKYAASDICLYIDSNIEVKKSLKVLIDKFEAGNYDMSLMPHPLNSRFPDEYRNWIAWRNYPMSQAQKFFKFLQSMHYDIQYNGLFQGCFKIVRKGKLNDDFSRMTFSILKYLGDDNSIERIDQTVFSAVLNVWFNDIKVLPVSEQILRSPYMQWYWHNSTQQNNNIFYDISKPDIKWMFNSKVECLYLL